MTRSIHFMVSGRVQGVFFRASTKEKADQLGLNGWVRNLHDGRVEGKVEGGSDNVQIFENWLKDGPGMARVDDLIVDETEKEGFEGFTIR